MTKKKALSLAAKKAAEADQDVIETLKGATDMAESGELAVVIVLGEAANGNPVTGFSAFDKCEHNLFQMIGLLDGLKYQLLEMVDFAEDS